MNRAIRQVMPTTSEAGRQEFVDEYVATSRAFADSVKHLRLVCSDTEAFIRELSVVGMAHRACEHSRVRLEKYLKSGNAVRLP